MPERVVRAQRWSPGAIRAGRAAAFLSLATGVNGMLAPYAHSWDPRWLYVATVGLVAALDGWLIGIAAAVGAVVCYELMSFGAFGFVADRDSMLLAAAVVAAIAARTLRLTVARQRLTAARAPQLLTGIIQPSATDDARSSAATLDATAALRSALEEERSRTERERLLRIEKEDQSRALLEATRSELRELKQSADEMTRRNSELQSAVDAAESTARSTAATIADLERRGERLRAGAADAAGQRDEVLARAADLDSTIADLRTRLEREEASSASARDRVHDLEQVNAQMTAAVADLTTAREAATMRIEGAERERRDLVGKIADLEVGRDDADARATDLQWSREQLQQKLEESQSLERAALGRAAELDEGNAQLRAALAAAEAAQRESARRITQLEEAVEHLNAEAGQERYRLDSAWSEKLARNAVDITDRFNAALMAADARTDAAHAEAAGLAARIESLSGMSARIVELEQLNAQLRASATEAEGKNDTAALRLQIAEIEAGAARLAESHAADLRRAEEEWSEKFARSAMDITQRFQSELASAVEQLDLLRSDNEAAAERIRELEIENHDIRAAAETAQATLEDDWTEKLQTIVHHLASDHEADIGQATLEKEEARAEARRLAKRVSQLETNGREIASTFEEIQRRNEALRLEMEEQRSRADSRDSEWSARLAANALELTQRFNGTMAAADARLQEARREGQTLASRIHELEQINAALRVSDQERRAAIDAEWSEKLGTIVNHLASDHEADIGQAIVEREEARAEGRHSNSRLVALQKSVAAERAAFEESQAQWTRERDELTRSVELLRRRLGLGTQSGGTPLPEASAPRDGNPAVLVVHRDSAVRAIAKHALEASGYDVTTASDGLEAFRVAMSQKLDVILAESTMPKMDGRELVQMLKSRPETAAVKIVLMVGAGNEGGSYASSDFHADDFLRDPANVEALKTTLANVLAARL